MSRESKHNTWYFEKSGRNKGKKMSVSCICTQYKEYITNWVIPRVRSDSD